MCVFVQPCAISEASDRCENKISQTIRKKIKNKQNTKTKKQQTKTRQPYENVGREPQKSSQGSRGWVPFVNLIRKTTGQSDS